jgi:aminoglycoside phosphotransferase (APT) family kinase protein
MSLILKSKPNVFSKTYKAVLTHGNLHMSNILVDGGRLSRIISWECAAFMPKYWEFTKAMRSVKAFDERHIAFYREI